MIIVASQRGGAKQLGEHLLKTEENEHVEVHEIRGFVSDDVVGALKEAYAVSQGTRCKQFLFSVSLNPPETENVPHQTFETALSRIEERNGLNNQPRVVVFHEKEGRRHCHAVWSRIDTETMTARPLPHFKLKMRDIAKELYLENDWKMPRGFIERQQADPRNFTLAEWQQAKRAGYHAGDLKGIVQDCWAASDSRESFSSALQERGMRLARGDRRGHVVVTHEGQVFGVGRCTGKPARQVRDRLGHERNLASVEETKSQIAQEMTPVFENYLTEARDKARQSMQPLNTERLVMAAAQRSERATLDRKQKERWEEESRERSASLNKGLRGLWDRFSGEHRRQRREHERQAYEAFLRDRQQRQDLIEAQCRDRQALQDRIKEVRALALKERLEVHSRLAQLRKGELEPDKPCSTEQPGHSGTRLSEAFAQNSRDSGRQSEIEARLAKLREGSVSSHNDRLQALRERANDAPPERNR